MRIALDHRRWAVALWTVGAVSGMTYPNIAQAGFFDFLFGLQDPAARSYDAYPGHPQGAYPEYRKRADYGSHRHAHKNTARRKLIVADKSDHPIGPQAPVDIMNDESLQRGDAVMTHAGIRIFVGYSGGRHRPEDFRKISEIKKLSQRERSALAALDMPGSKAGGQTNANASLITGRSATEHKVTAGETITDPNGRTVRYVGP